jgi:Zn-dependent peptidase ImmA (M78 family)
MRISVKKELISWARERAGLEPQDLLNRFPKFTEWEKGTALPTLNQLESLATRLFAPLGYFFLATPPTEELPIKDFRSRKDKPTDDPSPNLLDTVFAMQQRQAWFKEFAMDEGAEPLPFVRSVTIKSDPNAVAADIRKTLAIAPNWANSVPTWTEALDELGMKAEQAGILVVWNGVVGNNPHRKLDVSEFQGFVLSDSYAPLIFINNADFKAAQMFTIAHELAHIWLGSAGVFNFEKLIPADSETEQFCNKVAAELLVPTDEISVAWRMAKNSVEPFQIIARRFKISPLVAARRALDLGYISKQDFFDFYNNYLTDERRKKAAKKPGGDFYANCNYRIGRPFAEAVLRATYEGKLLYHEAYKLTGLSGTTFDKYFKQVRSESQ